DVPEADAGRSPLAERRLPAQVAEQLADGPPERPGDAVVGAAAGHAAGPGGVVIDVVDDDQVEPAVAVVIEEGRRGPPQRVVQARLPGDVGEGAIAVVQEELDAAVLGD